MLLPIFCSPEDYVDFNIEIGLLSKGDRKTEIHDLYRNASEILFDIINGKNQNVYV